MSAPLKTCSRNPWTCLRLLIISASLILMGSMAPPASAQASSQQPPPNITTVPVICTMDLNLRAQNLTAPYAKIIQLEGDEIVVINPDVLRQPIGQIPNIIYRLDGQTCAVKWSVSAEAINPGGDPLDGSSSVDVIDDVDGDERPDVALGTYPDGIVAVLSGATGQVLSSYQILPNDSRSVIISEVEYFPNPDVPGDGVIVVPTNVLNQEIQIFARTGGPPLRTVDVSIPDGQSDRAYEVANLGGNRVAYTTIQNQVPPYITGDMGEFTLDGVFRWVNAEGLYGRDMDVASIAGVRQMIDANFSQFSAGSRVVDVREYDGADLWEYREPDSRCKFTFPEAVRVKGGFVIEVEPIENRGSCPPSEWVSQIRFLDENGRERWRYKPPRGVDTYRPSFVPIQDLNGDGKADFLVTTLDISTKVLNVIAFTQTGERVWGFRTGDDVPSAILPTEAKHVAVTTRNGKFYLLDATAF